MKVNLLLKFLFNEIDLYQMETNDLLAETNGQLAGTNV
jgi:hypothetical protein